MDKDMPDSQASNMPLDDMDDEQRKKFETEQIQKRNHFIIQSYVEHYNELLVPKNNKNNIRDVWTAVEKDVKNMGYRMERKQITQVYRNVKKTTISKTCTHIRKKTGGGKLPPLTPTQAFFLKCHAGKELTQGIDGALELGFDKFKKLYANDIQNEMNRMDAEEKSAKKKPEGFKPPAPSKRPASDSGSQSQSQTKVAKIAPKFSGEATIKKAPYKKNDFSGILKQSQTTTQSQGTTQTPTALIEASPIHLQALHNSTPVKLKNGVSTPMAALHGTQDDGSESPPICGLYDRDFEDNSCISQPLIPTVPPLCGSGKKRVILSQGNQQVVMEANDSMTSSQFISSVREMQGKEINFATGSTQNQSASLFTNTMNSSLNTPNDYIIGNLSASGSGSSLSGGGDNVQSMMTMQPKTHVPNMNWSQQANEIAPPRPNDQVPVSGLLASASAVLHGPHPQTDLDETIDPNEEMNELRQIGTQPEEVENSTIDQSQLHELMQVQTQVSEAGNVANDPENNDEDEDESDVEEEVEDPLHTKDYDYVSLDPDNIPLDVLKFARLKMQNFMDPMSKALIKAAKLENVVERQRFVKTHLKNVVRPNIAAIVVHQLFHINGEKVLAKALHSVPKDEDMSIKQKKLYYIYKCQKIAEDMRHIAEFMDIFRDQTGPLFQEFLSSKRKRQPVGRDHREIRSKRENGLCNILDDDFFIEDRICDEPEGDAYDCLDSPMVEQQSQQVPVQDSVQDSVQGGPYDHFRFMVHPSFEKPMKGRVWTESQLKRTQVSYLTADRYRVDEHICALKEIRRNAVARATREKDREDREQLQHDMRLKEHEFAKAREQREIEVHSFLKEREAREQAEHDVRLELLKAKRDFYLLQCKQAKRDLGIE